MGYRKSVPVESNTNIEDSKNYDGCDNNSEKIGNFSEDGISNKIIREELSLSATTTVTANVRNVSDKVVSPIGRVNQIRGYGKRYEDAVTVTVTALLDPPPHYILRPPQSQFPLTTSFTNNSYNLPLPLARAVGMSNVTFSRAETTGVEKISSNKTRGNTAIKEITPVVGTGGHPGHFTLFHRSNLGLAGTISNPAMAKDTLQVLPQEQIYNNNDILDVDDDQIRDDNVNAGSLGHADSKKKNGVVKEPNIKEKERPIMDQSERHSFEEQFRAEIALACCLPADNITIEEVITECQSFLTPLLELSCKLFLWSNTRFYITLYTLLLCLFLD